MVCSFRKTVVKNSLYSVHNMRTQASSEGLVGQGSADGTICLKVACLIGLCKACRKELWMLN